MVTKGAIVDGTLKLMAISGITAPADNSDITDVLQVLDDYALELESTGLHMGYAQPDEYGMSDPADDSGISDWMAGPLKKLLVPQACAFFGQQVPLSVAVTAEQGLRSLEHALVNVRPANNPATLPKGSGNEWAYRDNKFYPEEAGRLDDDTGDTLDEITLESERQNYFP